MRRFFNAALRITLAMLTIAAMAGARADTYPSKPVRIVVPYASGGGADILARVLGQKLADIWHQPVIVDNKPGAGSVIGTESVAKSPADGYTLLMASPSHPINATLYKTLNFNTAEDFAAVTLVASGPLVLVVNSSFPANTVKEFIALAKAKPAQLSFASAGSGSSPHLAGELFKKMAGVNMMHVPYKGTAPALTDLIGGQVTAMLAPLPTVVAYVRAGKLKALGVSTSKRFAALPDVPTIAESGLPGYEVLQWWGLVAPKGTPRKIVAEVRAQVAKVLQTPDVQERLASMGAEPGGGSPEQFDALIRDEIVKWGKVIEAADVKAD